MFFSSLGGWVAGKVSSVSHRLFPVLSAIALAVVPLFARGQSAASSPQQLASLDPVVVTANRFEEEYRVVPAHVTYISRKEIAESNIQTVNEAIIRLGGVVGRSSLGGGREQTIDLGGFGDTTQSNTVILVDGMPLSEADSTEVRISGIPIESVEAIELHRSSAGVLYGGGAVGGVINIITSLSLSDGTTGTSGSAYLGAGSFETTEYRVSARHVGQGLALSFSGASQSSDGYRRHSATRETTGYFSARYAASTALFGLSLSSDSQDFRTPGPLREAEFRLDRRAAQPESIANNTYNDIRQQRLAAFAETETRWAIFRLDGSLRSRELDAVAVRFGSPVGLGFSGESQHLAITARRPMDFAGFRNQFLAGYETLLWDQDRRYAPAGPLGARDTLESESKSLFFKNDLDIKSSATRFSFGYRSEQNDRSVRYENGTTYQRDYRQHAFDLGVSQRLDSQLTAYVKDSRSYRFANIDELATAPSSPPAFIPISLRPQTSRDLEIGLRQTSESGGRLQARLYQSRVEDEIIYDVFQYANINLDRTIRRGLDVDGVWPVAKTVRLSGSLSLREAKFSEGTNRGKEIPMSSPQSVMLGASWHLMPKHRLGLDSQWVGSQRPTGDYENLYRVPSYWVTNLRYEYRVGSFEISASVRNLFDRAYYSYATLVPRFDVNTFSAVYDYTGVYPDNGRNFWASVRYRF